MKKYTYLIIAGFFGSLMILSGCTKKVQVPEKVSTAFAFRFKNVDKVKWSKESDTEYEAEFHQGKVEMSANFTADGELVEIEKEISKKDLPAEVTSTLDSMYAGYRIEEVVWTETDDDGSFYEIEVEKKREELIVHIDQNGKVLSGAGDDDDGDDEGEIKGDDDDGDDEGEIKGDDDDDDEGGEIKGDDNDGDDEGEIKGDDNDGDDEGEIKGDDDDDDEGGEEGHEQTAS